MRIAISGTIGSGKSMVSAYLRDKGYPVFDCDYENSRLLEKNQEGYRKVKEAFPECFIDDELDRRKLADVVFHDPKNRKKLEGIMHPLILKKLYERQEDPLFAEVPLLFEVGWDKYFDHNLLIVSDEKIILERLVEKGYTQTEARKRIAAQMDVEEKIRRADKIIYNNGSLAELYDLVDEWLENIIC